jgi:hypothetical protein
MEETLPTRSVPRRYKRDQLAVAVGRKPEMSALFQERLAG